MKSNKELSWLAAEMGKGWRMWKKVPMQLTFMVRWEQSVLSIVGRDPSLPDL